jgi:hypothetical protein
MSVQIRSESTMLTEAKGSRRWIVKPVLASSSLVSHPKWKVPLLAKPRAAIWTASGLENQGKSYLGVFPTETLRERSLHLPLNIRLMPKSEALY